MERWSNMINSSDPRQRFYDFLPDRPYWGKTKNLNRIGRKEDIIRTANYIQLPTQKRGYIALDLDYEMSYFGWMDDILPEPTLIIENMENAHSQYFFELNNPVLLPLVNGNINISWKSIRYFDAVTAGYQNKLRADKGFVQFGIKNPFSCKWKVYWADKTYDLNYLAEFVELPSAKYNHDDEFVFEGRHMEIFHRCRKMAYRVVKDYGNYEPFETEVKFICLNYCAKNIWINNKNKDFIRSEVLSIAKSIAKWTWKHHLDKNFKNYTKNIGIMKLNNAKNIDEPVCDNKIKKKMHQSSGARYTHEIRKNNTLETIKDTVFKLKNLNKAITLDNIIRFSSLSESTIYRYRNEINNL
jgi:hypothetical protein